MHLVDTLGPIIVVTALGWLVFRTGFFPRAALGPLNHTCYWIGLPALLFHSLARVREVTDAAMPMVVTMVIATFVTLALGYAGARLLKLPEHARGTFVQAGFRGNLAYIGLPIILYSLPAGAEIEPVKGVVLIAMAPIIILYNTLAVTVLLASQADRGPGLARRVAGGVVTNPLLIATALGAVVGLSGIQMPLILDRSLGALGQLALPLALLCVGGSLATVQLGGQRLPALATAILKVAVAPLVGAAGLALFGLGGVEARAVLVLLACPSAVAGYTMAVQLGGDEALASSSVVLSTLLALPALAIVLLLA